MFNPTKRRQRASAMLEHRQPGPTFVTQAGGTKAPARSLCRRRASASLLIVGVSCMCTKEGAFTCADHVPSSIPSVTQSDPMRVSANPAPASRVVASLFAGSMALRWGFRTVPPGATASRARTGILNTGLGVVVTAPEQRERIIPPVRPRAPNGSVGMERPAFRAHPERRMPAPRSF